MNQTINGLKEGYWEDYHSNGQLSSKGNFINGNKEGYWEYYYNDGKLNYREYHII